MKDIIAREKCGIVGIQETIRQDFHDGELRDLTNGVPFLWNWVLTKGHSRGILLDIKDDFLEIERWNKGGFFMEAGIRNRLNNIRWRMMVVYRPTNHSLSDDFISELQQCCLESNLPLVMGGDFNLIRETKDKSSHQGDNKLMELFNSFIEKNNLREIRRCGARFTWTNKQLNPIQSNIDRVLCSTEWEQMFPLCTVGSLTRVGSDHWPLVLEDGAQTKVNKRCSDLKITGCRERASIR